MSSNVQVPSDFIFMQNAVLANVMRFCNPEGNTRRLYRLSFSNSGCTMIQNQPSVVRDIQCHSPQSKTIPPLHGKPHCMPYL